MAGMRRMSLTNLLQRGHASVAGVVVVATARVASNRQHVKDSAGE